MFKRDVLINGDFKAILEGMVRPETEARILTHRVFGDSALCFTNGWKSRPGNLRKSRVADPEH